MRLAIMGAAALFAMSSTTMAADLGGNCCADLEERVAELEATVARKGNRKVSLEVSGHVNQAVMFWSGFGDLDESIDDNAILNNSNSESRFRFKGSAQISPDWDAGFLMELGTGDINNSGSPTVRHQMVWIKSKQLGMIQLGKTSEATDGIMEISLASADASTTGSWAPFDAFIKDQTGLGLNSPFDGTRKNVVRYNTPTIAGFVLSAAWAEEKDWDIALRYAGEFGGFRLAAGIGYRDEDVSTTVALNPTGGDRQFWGGSLSVMHVASGIFLDAQYGDSKGLQKVDIDLNKLIPVIAFQSLSIGVDTELVTYGGRIGFAKKLNSLGKTTVYGEWSRIELKDFDIDPQLYGVGVVQDIDAAAMSLYLSYRHYDLDLGTDDSADVVLIGSKIRF